MVLRSSSGSFSLPFWAATTSQVPSRRSRSLVPPPALSWAAAAWGQAARAAPSSQAAAHRSFVDSMFALLLVLKRWGRAAVAGPRGPANVPRPYYTQADVERD